MEIVEFECMEEKLAIGALSSSGMLAIRGVPGFASLRSQLLPMAKIMALMPPADRANLLKSINLGTDVSFKRPDRLVSSFATQLSFQNNNEESTVPSEIDQQVAQAGALFRRLGQLLVEVALKIARLCDSYVGMQLEQTIIDSQTAKGRLIHYHSQLERTSATGRAGKNNRYTSDGYTSINDEQQRWQQWHYDYGILTMVTSPMFVRDMQPVSAPDGHSSLVAMDNSTGEVHHLDIPEDCVLVQVGEAAEILSGGKLKATAHCVTMPSDDVEVSRETFVVFMQPSWDKVLEAPTTLSGFEGKRMQLLDGIIPPLGIRWKQGWTFADFSKETTRQYYGSSGVHKIKSTSRGSY